MKKNMLLMLVLLIALTSILALDIEIGNGTTISENMPVNGSWDYSWSSFIINSDLIGTDALFEEIKFNPSNNPSNFTFTNQKLYFKETTDSEITAPYPNPEENGFTLVYDGDVTFNGSGYQGVVLDTPFAYNGTSNLHIVWENHDGTYFFGGPSFYTTEVGTNVGAYKFFIDSFPIDDGVLVTYFPNLILSYSADSAPTLATYSAPENNSFNIPTTTTLQWELGENTTDVDLYFSSLRSDVNNLNPEALVVDGENVTSYEAENLSTLTDYYWRVISRNSANDLVVNGPIWRFTTQEGEGIVAVNVGDGTTSNPQFPFSFWYRSSVAETIYLAEEINQVGLLTNISFFNNFTTNLTDKEINIWVGETTQTDLTNYIPASQLTNVFSGTADFPSQENIITIELDTPYNYSGGNLVVLTQRVLDTTYYTSTDLFYNTETDLSNRTIWWQDLTDSFDPNNMANGTATNKMPNVVFYFAVSGIGSVSGNVTDGTSGLGGVAISIDNTDHSTLSLADGSFEFPYVNEGENYTLTASLHGYPDATTTFDVVGDEETVVNIEMAQLTNVTVSGQVITNDTGLGVQANITLTGYEDYAVESDVNGNFTIPDVFVNQSYTARAMAQGYQPTTFAVVVEDEDLSLGTVLVNEILFPATGVLAELEGDNVQVTWNEPSSAGEGEWLTKAAEEVVDGIGTGAPAIIEVAHMYTEAELVDYQGMNINSVRISPREASASYTLKVWGGSDGNTELYSQVITDFVNEAWNEYMLDSSVPIPTSGPVYIGYTIDTPTGFPAGCDVGPAVPGGDMIKLDNQPDWDFLSQTTNIDINWSIQAFVSWQRGEQIASGGRRVLQNTNLQAPLATKIKRGNLETITNSINNNRSFEAYNLYRFLVEDEANMDNWDLIEEETTALSYSDTDWSDLTDGFYKYSVRAIYTDDALSIPATSNWLQNSALSTITMNVQSNIGDILADAYVTITAQTENPNGEFTTFEGTTNASGLATIEVNAGIYNITVTKAGFTPYSNEVDASADVVVNASLEELAFAPLGVVAEQTGEDAVITWSVPVAGGEVITESFEEEFPPTNWSTIVTNTTQSWAHYETVPFPDGDIVPTEGMYQAGVMWTDSHQDEWLITDAMSCPAGNLSFDFYGIEGSIHADNYFVKISTDDGSSWTPLWNATDLPASENFYDRPIVIDLSNYVGQNIKIAWNFVDGDNQGLWAATYIDNINIGGRRVDTRDLLVISNARSTITKTSTSSSPRISQKRDPQEIINKLTTVVDYEANIVMTTTSNPNRALEGYKVWRLLTNDQANEANWTLLTNNVITELTYTDSNWNTLPSGAYKYAVKAIYSNNNLSVPSFSNILFKDMYGTVDGLVMNESNTPIEGASLILDGNTITTDASGNFLFTDVQAGDYEITATATGYIPSTQTITVVGTQTTTVNFILSESSILFSDSFETYPDFALEVAPWVLVDGDLSGTYSITNTTWENAETPQAYIVFNPLMTTPPLVDENYNAVTGLKYMASFAATSPDNNDWLVSQEFTLGNSGSFNFWGKSITDQYGLERFNVLVSTGSTNPSDFTPISGPAYTEAPTSWTQFTYSLNDYANESIRVAIQCVSSDAFIFMVDDVEIDAPGGTDIETTDILAASQLKGNYPNPFNPETTIAFSTKEKGNVSLDIYNIRGQKVRSLLNESRESGSHSVVWNGKDDQGKKVASGIFFYRMKSGNYSATKKMILMK